MSTEIQPFDSMNSSRRRFLATGGGVALLALSTAYGNPVASAAPRVAPSEITGGQAFSTTDDAANLIVNWFRQWRFDFDRTGHILLSKESFSDAGRNYNLHSTEAKALLQYEGQRWGINLGWTDNDNAQTARRAARWFLRRPGTDSSPLKYGEMLGLGNGGNPSFLRYSHRTFGINLEWSHAPSYEWQVVRGPGTTGLPIVSGERLALYNPRAGREGFLLHFDRTVGGDIGWPDSKTWWEQVPGHLKALAKRLGKEAWEEAKVAARQYLTSQA